MYASGWTVILAPKGTEGEDQGENCSGYLSSHINYVPPLEVSPPPLEKSSTSAGHDTDNRVWTSP